MIYKFLAILACIWIFPPIFSQYEESVFSFYYDYNKSIPTEQSINKFNDFITHIDNSSILKIQIDAYADSIGNENGNLKIGELRIKNIQEILATQLEKNIVIEATNHGSSYQKEHQLPSEETRKVKLLFILETKKVAQRKLLNPVFLKEPSYDYEIDTITNQIDSLSTPQTIQKTTLQTKIQFEGDKVKYLTPPIMEFEKIVSIYNTDTNLNLLVKGHVCCGNNYSLSLKRARKVYKDLIKKGIPKSHISYQGFGNTEPLVIEKDEYTRRINRRVEIYFY